MEHRFEARAAEVVGVNAAILLHNLAYWCNHNRHNDRHLHRGAYWTYNSNKALREQFPYLGRDAIESAIRRLEEGGYVVIDNFSDDRRDRTRWFSVTKEGYALDRNDECGDVADAAPREARVETETKRDERDGIASEAMRYLNERAGTSFNVNAKSHLKFLRGRLAEGYTLDDFKRVIDTKVGEWLGTEMETYLRPSTLFALTHFDEYLNSASTRSGGSNGKYSAYD